MKQLCLVLACAIGVGGAVQAQGPAEAPAASASEAAGPASTTATNAQCPVSPDEAVDPSFFTMYKGRKISFCCKKCMVKFKADPEAYVANLDASVFDASLVQ